jgi:DNA polymerase III sliding clamp (beta) subunit (PCNA family)
LDLEAEVIGEFETGMNWAYCADILDVVDWDNAEIVWADDHSPIGFRNADSPFRSVVMPMRMGEND